MKAIPLLIISLYIGVSYYTSVGVGLLIVTCPVIILSIRSWMGNYRSASNLNRLLQEKAKVGMEALGATTEELANGT